MQAVLRLYKDVDGYVWRIYNDNRGEMLWLYIVLL